jgi:hypothetical protein
LGSWLIGLLLIFVYLLLEKPLSRWISTKSLVYKIDAIFIVPLLIIGIGYIGNASSINWKLPSIWTNQALAAGADARDPYNLEGTFTIAGVWFGFTAGFACLLAQKSKIVVKGTLLKRIARYSVGLASVGFCT